MGLDLELFEDEVPEDFLCGICHKVLHHPVAASCSHHFCRACLKRLLKTDKQSTCLTCYKRLKNKTWPPSVPVKVKLLNLLVRCRHDCGRICRLGELADHEAEECTRKPISCPHAHQGCRKKVKPAGLQEHAQKCDFRLVQCEGCGHHMVYGELITHQNRKKCVENKLRRQVFKAVKLTNNEVTQHRQNLHRQHLRLEHQQRQRMVEHHRQLSTSNSSSRLQRARSNLYNHSNAGSSVGSAYNSPRVPASESHLDLLTAPPSAADMLLASSMSLDDGEMTLALNTPTSRWRLPLKATCRNCKKEYLENVNSPNSCRWHQGVELFTCYSCGRLDYQKGCMMGYHEM